MGDEENLQLTEFENAGGDVQDSGGDGARGSSKELDAVYDVPVQVSAVLGRAQMQVSQLLKLGRGAVVELDRKVGEAVDIYHDRDHQGRSRRVRVKASLNRETNHG